MDCQGKRSWPELVGTDRKRAKAIIERQNPRVDVKTVKEGSAMVSLDFRCDRVWLWVDEHYGIVTRTPQVG